MTNLARANAFVRLVRPRCATGVSLVLWLMLMAEGRALDFTYTNIGGTITITGYTGPGGNVTIPSVIDGVPVTSLGDNAFLLNTNLTAIAFPSGVTNIGGGAFIDCTNLSSVMVPGSLTTIGLYAFAGCAALTNFTLPDGVTSIGRVAFQGCTGLTHFTLPASVSSIGDSVFADCTGLNSVTIANKVIGSSEFSDCPSLASVTISGGVSSIPDFAFNGCASLKGIAIPEGVTNIGVNAFSGCSSLTRTAIPDSLITIADGIIGWGLSGAFSDCTSLTNITLGKGLTYIGNGAFVNCVGLTNLTIPAGVTNIGDYAFTGCTNIMAVYFQGNAPSPSAAFAGVPYQGGGAITPTLYYLPGTSGWGPFIDGCPTMLWNPQVQMTDGSFGVRQNQFGFNIRGTADIPLVIEATADLRATSWIPLQSCTLTNGLLYFSDPQWKNYSGRFYRIRSP